MATIDIKLSQSAVNTNHALELKDSSSSPGGISALVDAIAKLDYLVSENYYYYTSLSSTSNSLTFKYADGATQKLVGSLDNPNSYSGYATVTSQSITVPNLLKASSSGFYRYSYDNYGSLSFQAISGTSNKASYSFLQSDPDLGKVGINFEGAITTNFSTDNFSGSLSKLTLTASKFVSSTIIEGNLSVTGNSRTIASGSTSSSISGTLTGYRESYKDGSYVKISGDGGSVAYDGADEIGYQLLSDANNWGGNDTIKLDLPSSIYDEITIASGEGDDVISIKGGINKITVNAGDGNDTITSLGGNHYIAGGQGHDTYIVDSTTDSIIENFGEGTDTIQSSINYQLSDSSNIENLTLIGKKSINGTGSNGNNMITGNSAVNKINGGNGDDQINGGAGNDVIDGSLGNDALTGGKGNDFFVFSTLIDSVINLDTILDFKSSGADKIHLSKTIFTQVSSITPTAKGVALSSSDFLSSTSVNEATNSGQHILYNKSTGALFYDADGSGANSAVQIALIGTTPQHPELIAKDFFVII